MRNPVPACFYACERFAEVSSFKISVWKRGDKEKSFKQMSCVTYIVYAYDGSVMTKKSTKFCHKAVKFRRHNKECNAVSKEFKCMRMTTYRRRVNTTRKGVYVISRGF